MEERSPLDHKVVGKTLWQWMQVLIVPIAIALFTLVFSVVQSCSLQRTESQRAQDAALQSYLDQMSTLILEKSLRSSVSGSEVSILARARTLTVLRSLDSSRKTDVLSFLVDAELVMDPTESEIALARDAASEYLKQDPADDGVRMALEQLNLLEGHAAGTKIIRLLLRPRR